MRWGGACAAAAAAPGAAPSKGLRETPGGEAAGASAAQEREGSWRG